MRTPLSLLPFTVAVVSALKYDPEFVGYNLNENKSAENVLNYWGEWPDHTYHQSPSNWRFPFYSLFLDRFVDGDPANNDINGTLFETDLVSNQFRFGGDLKGLEDSLDYIQGMGIKGIYIAGSPFMNLPWKADSYSPIDFSLLDKHFGNIEAWRSAIDNIHSRGMYVILDNTMGTMADLLGFEGFLNVTAPINPREYKTVWKSDRRYFDFAVREDYKEECSYPTFYNESGHPVIKGVDYLFDQLKGCFDSEFDQYGDTNSISLYPDWQRSLSKAGLVQDRLREWFPSVREKIQRFSCIMIASLDIDGFRFDKAGQITVDAFADYSESIRDCARKFGKDNFFISGEFSGGNNYAAIYFGRGREPEMAPQNLTEAVLLTNNSDDKYFLRGPRKNAVDAAAFHYSIYRSLTRFLGMDGNFSATFDVGPDFVDAWNNMMLSNDLINPNSGRFDPRHMLGTSNQDTFRWPAIKQGTEKMLLGQFITTLHIPGIPALLWGEEQAFYVLDNTHPSYLFGRQPISSALAWQNQGCYGLGSSQYYKFPAEAALIGCHDDSVGVDHRDPTHPVRNIIKAMYYLRERFPTLNDGYYLQSLSKQIRDVILPGSNGTATETGMWSVLRDQYPGVQNLTTSERSATWLVYQNEDKTVNYSFDCSSSASALIAPFDEGTTVKNLLAPFDEIKLKAGRSVLGIHGSKKFNGCLDNLQLKAFDFRAYVPKNQWIPPPPMMTKFSPGHDARIESKVAVDGKENLEIEFQFSENLDCNQVTKNLLITSTTEDKSTARLDESSVSCTTVSGEVPKYIGEIVSAWSWRGKLIDVANGVHALTVQNASTADGNRFTDSIDRVMFRIGQKENPIVFPRSANYTRDSLFKDSGSGILRVDHKAPGADMWRYSMNWASTWSEWKTYKGGTSTLDKQPWTGTKRQKWDGDHVILQYWSKLAGSSNHIQHADVGRSKHPPRRFPHLFAMGEFNAFGSDTGAKDEFYQGDDGLWKFHLIAEWPTNFQVNVWGMNPDKKPDRTYILGDIANNSVLNRLTPDSLSQTIVNFTEFPPPPHIAYRMEINDGNFRYQLVPEGSRLNQIIIYALLWSIPVLTGTISVWTYMGAFYGVKFNRNGVTNGLKKHFLQFFRRHKFEKLAGDDEYEGAMAMSILSHSRNSSPAIVPTIAVDGRNRLTVLIATIEYDIEDWGIKIKIGGLGVMAQLMGKNLPHHDLIWVIPCVGSVDYPVDKPADPMFVTILDRLYEIKVQYHQLRNITYVLLDAPVFRQQTKSEPYPPRMDDFDSAIYYSAWNACIAETIKRFSVDIYHINDYHGAAAPLYLLPHTIPCCLSLHNAEFQGLWPMRNRKEVEEVSKIFNLDLAIIEKYVQFGDVFNLLHAGASYLRVHQKGFGAVGVSNKYGDRSYARYPIFWGLKEIGKLPNPDPSDTEFWDPDAEIRQVITVDPAYEASRVDLRRQAQEWAQLDVNPKAELFVFVGRWSVQKGVDLIADVFPAVLEKHRNVQLICVGPVIDIYGKFAALKLNEMMKKYPRRVYSKPEFTALPPYIFSGAEFALIPSRDEPFGLVAVEFGRKGALGVGARVGGLGQMPGWWYTVESMTTKHLQKQFKLAIDEALASKTNDRAMMRARAAKQRFPVARWVEDLDHLYAQSIRLHNEERRSDRRGRRTSSSYGRPRSTSKTNSFAHLSSDRSFPSVSLESLLMARTPHLRQYAPPALPIPRIEVPGSLGRTLSLGVRAGPGHRPRHTAQDGEGNEQLPNLGEEGEPDECTITAEQAEAIVREDQRNRTLWTLEGDRSKANALPLQPGEALLPERQRGRSLTPRASLSSDDLGRSCSPPSRDSLIPKRPSRRHKASSMLSLNEVRGGRHDFMLQNVDATFNDTTGEYYRYFEGMLQRLNGKTSENELCIEQFLVKSEKEWADRMRDAKLGRHSHQGSRSPSPYVSPFKRNSSPYGSVYGLPGDDSHDDGASIMDDSITESLLPNDFKRPSFIKRWMAARWHDWPIYSFLLGIGQIIAANSYQITLLTSGSGQSSTMLYVLGPIYVITTCIWWYMFRRIRSFFLLTLPFVFYGLAFVCIGIASLINKGRVQDWARYIATGMYIVGSSSGYLFFALNFGDEGGAQIKSLVYRACIVQGTQSIYIAALFCWGSTIVAGTSNTSTLASSPTMAAITMPIAILLWAIGLALFTGLPDYYRQSPGKTPYFYKSIFNRNIILWFLVTVVLQNYFLSAPYGRNWAYLWSSKYAPQWAIFLLVITFYIGVWACMLAIFGRLSKVHSWMLPIFAIGLGAPRWAQILWGTSGLGLWVPWMPGGPAAGAIAGRVVWLWLGVLDAIQGIGFGMMLLQTLTRIHIAASLAAAQLLGTAITLIAKATAPDRDGPGDVFPDFSAGVVQAISKPWFWMGLGCQLIVPIGFLKFFRKEQLSKP